MKNALRIVLAFCLLSVAVFAAEEGRFFTYPTIHDDKIVFTYESDLWTVERQGRRRLAPDDLPRHRDASPSSRPTASGSPSRRPTTAPRPSTSCRPRAARPSA